MNLHTPGRFIMDGQILFAGKNLLQLTEKEMIHIRGNQISMIFQEPMVSLNPVYTIGMQMTEMILLHQKVSKKQAKEQALGQLKQVAIADPQDIFYRYPYELSGGMRQRVMIAMAMANHPQLLIADEPTTALDVTIQAQILDLMRTLRQQTGASILLITHDLGVVAEMCDRVIVMYAGRIVEQGMAQELFADPKHPYTIGLLQSLPRLNGRKKYLDDIPGNVPAPQHYTHQACRFAPRCRFATALCHKAQPGLRQLSDTHGVYCFLWNKEPIQA